MYNYKCVGLVGLGFMTNKDKFTQVQIKLALNYVQFMTDR